ncbi:MAG: Type secretion system protein [Firmicutes bacterium]|nr:Type secretion system protein [Bacillota bacterium]
MATIIIFSALTTFIVLLLVYRLVTREEAAVNVRITKYVEAASPKVSAASWDSLSKSWLGIVRYLSNFVGSSAKSKYFNMKLMQAAIPLRGSEFFVIVLMLSIGIGLVGFIVTKGNLAAGIGFGLLTYLVSHVYLNMKIKQRLKAFDHQLGETLELMSNALRSGHSFLQTVDMVSKEMTPPISQEFGRMLKEMNLGAPTEIALANLTKRVESNDLDLAVTAINIQRQVGGNLAEIMDNIAATIKSRHMMKREIQTLTAQGRISGWIIGVIPFALGMFIWISNPGYIQPLFTDPLGKMFVGYGLFSQFVGIVILKRIIDIEM